LANSPTSHKRHPIREPPAVPLQTLALYTRMNCPITHAPSAPLNYIPVAADSQLSPGWSRCERLITTSDRWIIQRSTTWLDVFRPSSPISW